jgi:hypothetical protein
MQQEALSNQVHVNSYNFDSAKQLSKTPRQKNQNTLSYQVNIIFQAVFPNIHNSRDTNSLPIKTSSSNSAPKTKTKPGMKEHQYTI